MKPNNTNSEAEEFPPHGEQQEQINWLETRGEVYNDPADHYDFDFGRRGWED